MAASLPPLPASLKPIQHYLKTAHEHDKRDPAVAYYCRLYALQRGMELDKSSPEARSFLLALMDIAEKLKKDMADNEAVKSEVVGQAHLEDYALKLFFYADNEDRAGRFGKNVVKAFYTAGMLFDVLTQFGELSEDVEAHRKYAKWKAAYIHNCLKNGETPQPGPLNEGDGEQASGGVSNADANSAGAGPPPIGFQQPVPNAGDQVPPGQSMAPSTQTPGYTPSQPAAVTPTQPPSITPTQPPSVTPTPPTSEPYTATWTPPPNLDGVKLTPLLYQKAIKMCKYASSALQYEDSATAIENLTKALKLLTTGQE